MTDYPEPHTMAKWCRAPSACARSPGPPGRKIDGAIASATAAQQALQPTLKPAAWSLPSSRRLSPMTRVPVGRSLQRFVSAGFAPSDSDQVRVQKATLTLVIGFLVLLSPVWIVTYLLLGRPLSAAIPAVYVGVGVLRLANLFRTKRPGSLVASQTLLFMVLPLALQWSLGGFERGSAVALWAFVAPLSALVTWGLRQAVRVLVALLLALVVSGLLESTLRALVPPLPEGVATGFWVLNVSAPLTTAFVLLAYFLHQRDLATARSEDLLRNVLPGTIADRLKAGSGQIADGYAATSVVFIDIVEFTRFAERTAPERLVVLLGRVFAVLDDLVERHGLEKIKTLGDGYLAVAGVPEPRPDHARAAAAMTLDTRVALRQALADDWPDLDVRIGIASGPLVAGVIGRRRFSYDLWGDTVNTASRMASLAEPGTIQLTQATRDLLEADAIIEPRGIVDVKGKGSLRTYRLVGLRAPPRAA
jgi:adenylate cyclase